MFEYVLSLLVSHLKYLQSPEHLYFILKTYSGSTMNLLSSGHLYLILKRYSGGTMNLLSSGHLYFILKTYSGGTMNLLSSGHRSVFHSQNILWDHNELFQDGHQ
jgi:hypothetical protein